MVFPFAQSVPEESVASRNPFRQASGLLSADFIASQYIKTSDANVVLTLEGGNT